MPLVYIATNAVNGKRYIGVTIRGVDNRRKQHVADAAKGSAVPFHRAIRKYGIDAFAWAILETHESEATVLAAEVRLIATLCPEYNVAIGGKGIPSLGHPEAIKAKMRAAHTPARRAAFSAKRKGYKHRADTVELLRAAGHAGKERFEQYAHLGPQALARPVICLDDGKEYPSLSAAGRAYGIDKNSIQQLCSGKYGRRTVGGKRFVYAGVEM